MERMDHFRNGKLLDGDRVILEGLDGHIGSRPRSKTRLEWFGYFELNDAQHITSGNHYQLVLEDGRSAEIYTDEVQNSDVPGRHVHVAVFYVVGEIRGMRRGMGMGMGLTGTYMKLGG